MWIILIIIVIIFLIIRGQCRDYKSFGIWERNFKNDLIGGGKELRKNAEAEMKKIKCKKGGKCNFVLKNKTKEHLEGWYDEITGHYECTKCKDNREEILQYPS